MGRVANKDPPVDRSSILKSTMGPEDCPKHTNVPRSFKDLSEPRQVSLPTESYTTSHRAPPVIFSTRAAKSSALLWITWA